MSPAIHCLQEARNRGLAGEIREQRRQFLVKGAAAMIVAAASSAITYARWPMSAPTELPPRISREFATWDAIYSQGGLVACTSMLIAAAPNDRSFGHRWIALRPIPSLYGLLVTELSHAAPAVRRTALAALESVPPVDLKPHLGAIRLAATGESDPILRKLLDDLAAAVARS